MSYITRAAEFYNSTLLPFLGTAVETSKNIAWKPVSITADYAQNKAFGHFMFVAEPTAMATRAVSELYETANYIYAFSQSSNENPLALIDRALIASCMAFAAIADSYQFVARITGRTVSPGLELAVIPARLLAATIASYEMPVVVRSTAVSQLAIVVEKASLAYSAAGYHKSAAVFSGVARTVETMARGYFVKNTLAEDSEETFVELVKRGWNRLRGNEIEEF